MTEPVSLLDRSIAEDGVFIERLRRAYLHAVCRESGLPIDIRAAALREAAAMIAVAAKLLQDSP